MTIEYATKQTWKKSISKDILSDFSTSNAKKINKFLPELESKKVNYVFSSLDKAFLDEFEPFYISHITSIGGTPFDIYQTTIAAKKHNYPYRSFSLYQDDQFVGGAVFTLREDRLSMVYRSFSTNWPLDEKQRCTPALLAEYLMTKYCTDQGRNLLYHGKDRNIFGPHSAIGVAIFKLSIGCHAELPEEEHEYEKKEMDLKSCTQNSLILEYPYESNRITTGHLVIHPGDEDKYVQLFKYPHLLQVNLHHIGS